MNFYRAKSCAKHEATVCGVNQYILKESTGEYTVTDSDSYYKFQTPVGWFSPDGNWHSSPRSHSDDPDEPADPSDKSDPTYDLDSDPDNDPRFWCVIDDDGYKAEGYVTRAEADAYMDGIEYCLSPEITIKGVFEADNADAAISLAKSEEES